MMKKHEKIRAVIGGVMLILGVLLQLGAVGNMDNGGADLPNIIRAIIGVVMTAAGVIVTRDPEFDLESEGDENG